MPAASMPVRHYRQSSPGMCLPACARTVLAALGDERSKVQLAALMGSYEFGTPASRITRLEKLGYNFQFPTTKVTAVC